MLILKVYKHLLFMLQKLKLVLLQKKLNKNLLDFNKSRVFLSKEIQTVGVLTTDFISSSLNLQQEIEQLLPVRNTKIMSYRNYSKKDAPSFNHFTQKDLNWNGEFTQQNLQSFLDQPFDLLIGYFTNSNIVLETAMVTSKATFKVGFSGVNSDLFDVEISGNTNQPQPFISELKKYLLILKKLKN